MDKIIENPGTYLIIGMSDKELDYLSNLILRETESDPYEYARHSYEVFDKFEIEEGKSGRLVVIFKKGLNMFKERYDKESIVEHYLHILTHVWKIKKEYC